MPRAVSHWTWRRAIRDHGPKDPSLRHTLYVIGTYMNNDGSCFPSQAAIAAGALVSERTVRRHIAEAERLGWIGVETLNTGGHAWRKNRYRCVVPDQLELPAKDAVIADGMEAQAETADPQRADTQMSGRPRQRVQLVKASPRGAADTQVSSRLAVIAGTSGHPDPQRADISTQREDKNGTNVRTSRCPTNSLLNSSFRTHSEARADAQARPVEKEPSKEDLDREIQERERKALKLLTAQPETTSAQLQQWYGLTPARTAELRQLAASTQERA